MSYFRRVRHRNALTEIAWEDATQGMGMAMSTVASEKNREMLFIGNVYCVLQTVTSQRVVALVFQGHDLLKIANINSQQEATLSPRERRKWSLGLGQHLKGASPNVRKESH